MPFLPVSFHVRARVLPCQPVRSRGGARNTAETVLPPGHLSAPAPGPAPPRARSTHAARARQAKALLDMGIRARARAAAPLSADALPFRRPGRAPAAVAVYPSFDKLTSVHVNSQNNFLVASGYTTSVRVYDLETATVLHDYDGIHTNHINISRFANHAPFVFSTSSFDGTCKTFDLRMKPTEGGIYTCKCGSGVVRLFPLYLFTFPLCC